MEKVYPSYLGVKDFNSIISSLEGLLSPCRVCPWKCGIDRSPKSVPGGREKAPLGKCQSGYLPKVASYNLHFGEEKPISGYRGSGTIFFSGCSLSCVFCQNYTISQHCYGREITTEELADYMLELQSKGAHNINLVTPTHFLPQIVKAISLAAKCGLSIPIVYNSSGYDRAEVLRLLDGIIDIYLPDLKYSSDEKALTYSGARNYVEVSRHALAEMYRQVGDLVTDENGIALRGLIVRHLVLPNDISGTAGVLEFLSRLSGSITVNLMNQYYPEYRAFQYPELSGRVTPLEFDRAVRLLHRFNIRSNYAKM